MTATVWSGTVTSLPTTTCKVLGSMPRTQCAAVRTSDGDTSVPLHSMPVLGCWRATTATSDVSAAPPMTACDPRAVARAVRDTKPSRARRRGGAPRGSSRQTAYPAAALTARVGAGHPRIVTLLRGLAAVVALSLAVLPACKDRVAEPAAADDGGWTPTSGTPEAKRRVSKDDCAKWAPHGVEATYADSKAAGAGCTPEARKALADKIDGERPSVDAAALALCSKHLGEEYAPADARCYLAARTARALADCKFSPSHQPRRHRHRRRDRSHADDLRRRAPRPAPTL